MTSVRLLTAAVLLCTASAFAQEQLSSPTRPNRTAEPEKSAQAAASEPWKLGLNQPRDTRDSSLQWQQLDPMAVRAGARPGDGPPHGPDGRKLPVSDTQGVPASRAGPAMG